MSCNCIQCNSFDYSLNTSLEVLLAFQDDLLSIIESLERKDIRNTLDHYKNRLNKVQHSIDYLKSQKAT